MFQTRLQHNRTEDFVSATQQCPYSPRLQSSCQDDTDWRSWAWQGRQCMAFDAFQAWATNPVLDAAAGTNRAQATHYIMSHLISNAILVAPWTALITQASAMQ